MSRFSKSVLLALSIVMVLGALSGCAPSATPTPVTIIKEATKVVEKVVVITATPAPVVDMTPAQAISSFVFYQGKAFPGWNGNIIVGTLRATDL